MYLKPTSPDVHVRDPRTGRHIPESGIRILEGDSFLSYWIRRKNDGDVVEVPDPAATPSPAPTSPSEE